MRRVLLSISRYNERFRGNAKMGRMKDGSVDRDAQRDEKGDTKCADYNEGNEGAAHHNVAPLILSSEDSMQDVSSIELVHSVTI
jgi:hypothetical protein